MNPLHHQWDRSDAATRLTEINCHFHKHRDDPIDSAGIIGVNSRGVRTGQRVDPSVRIVFRIIGASVWLDLEPVFDVEKKGIWLRTVLGIILVMLGINRNHYAQRTTPLRTVHQQELMPLLARILETLMQR